MFFSCKEEKVETPTKMENFESQFIGSWQFFHAKIKKERFEEKKINTIFFKDNFQNDSLVVEFTKQNEFKVNLEKKGKWKLIDDFLVLELKDFQNIPFPFNLSEKYVYHFGYIKKNLYLYANFFDLNGKINHSVTLIGRKVK